MPTRASRRNLRRWGPGATGNQNSISTQSPSRQVRGFPARSSRGPGAQHSGRALQTPSGDQKSVPARVPAPQASVGSKRTSAGVLAGRGPGTFDPVPRGPVRVTRRLVRRTCPEGTLDPQPPWAQQGPGRKSFQRPAHSALGAPRATGPRPLLKVAGPPSGATPVAVARGGRRGQGGKRILSHNDPGSRQAGRGLCAELRHFLPAGAARDRAGPRRGGRGLALTDSFRDL
jgi:hypothetical protein